MVQVDFKINVSCSMSHAFEGFKSLQKIAVTLNHYKDLVYENWATGQPDNKNYNNGLDKSAAVIDSDGSWHDYKIGDELEFVCLYTEYLAVPGKKSVLVADIWPSLPWVCQNFHHLNEKIFSRVY